ncbi:MAG: hypothetical protein KBC21_00690 [Candidatus Pacebacteria bacterium]|nr:hypothetical protein [Candidatus Paceibacterota bacterium]
MTTRYAPLQETILNDLDQTAPSFTGDSPSLSVTTSLIATLFFMLIGGAAFYRYAMAGIYRLEASENGIRRSNEAFKGATLGVLGIFLMFLIFFTFNRDLLLSDVGLSSLEVDAPAAQTTTTTTTTNNTTTPPGPLPTGACVGDKRKGRQCGSEDLPRVVGANDRQVREDLKASNIGVNVGACSSVGQSGCTNVGGMSPEIVSLIKSLKSACACNIVISGGTEWWSHTTHGPGALTVDLQIPKTNPLSDPLYIFITKQPSIGGTNLCHSRYTWSGWIFCDEKAGKSNRHWHINK